MFLLTYLLTYSSVKYIAFKSKLSSYIQSHAKLFMFVDINVKNHKTAVIMYTSYMRAFYAVFVSLHEWSSLQQNDFSGV